MEEIIRARVYAKVINVIPDPRENCVARCHLKVGAERIEFFRGTAADGSYLTYINFGKNCYFLIEQASQELYQKFCIFFQEI